MMELSELQEDAISELLNIGMGTAASALSQMVGEEVMLSVPSVTIVPRSEAAQAIGLGKDDQVSAVREHFTGSFWGDAMLLFPEGNSVELVRALLKEEMTLEMLSEMEQEALTEVGNIILNACLGSLANIFGDELHYEMPEFAHGACGMILADDKGGGSVLILRMDFTLQKTNVGGFLTLMMDVDSVQAFIAQIEQFMQEMA
ncbi:MAG: chemotaxis protein CheC [endosymbiont of Escarpia spicata]|uniref:Chemotaxis protein CheC n=1 Tax=endosymbiont of Escarpia spicata TaxID=2200908 RepID=A0A370DKZ4_9GAMM|nr:MAG: chemotaxis protein CheC [endosymbiont of Escarpia spicata]